MSHSTHILLPRNQNIDIFLWDSRVFLLRHILTNQFSWYASVKRGGGTTTVSSLNFSFDTYCFYKDLDNAISQTCTIKCNRKSHNWNCDVIYTFSFINSIVNGIFLEFSCLFPYIIGFIQYYFFGAALSKPVLLMYLKEEAIKIVNTPSVSKWCVSYIDIVYNAQLWSLFFLVTCY